MSEQGKSGLVVETFAVGLLGCNCTVIGDTASGEAMVIDPGDEVEGILERLAAHGLRVKQIVITHAHIDHVGGALKLKRATGAPVLMNERDIELLKLMGEQAEWVGVQAPEVAAPDASAEDGMLLKIGGVQGQVLHTPGHTEGSICLHFSGESLLVAGDTLFAGSIGRTDLWGGDGKAILRSIKDRLLVLPEETRVIAGHGRPTTIGMERERNPFLRGL